MFLKINENNKIFYTYKNICFFLILPIHSALSSMYFLLLMENNLFDPNGSRRRPDNDFTRERAVYVNPGDISFNAPMLIKAYKRRKRDR